MTDSSDTTRRFVLLSVNPKSGRHSSRERASLLARALESRGFLVEKYGDLNAVASRANELFDSNALRALVGVGGDGTASELVNRTRPGVPITLLPSGTANLIAKRFKLPFDPLRSATMIADGATLAVDAGRANGRLFLAMASAGVDAEIVGRVHSSREATYRRRGAKGGHISYFSYLKPLLLSIRGYRFPAIQTARYESLTSNAPCSELVGVWSLVFNLPNYGWGVRLAPNCNELDGAFDYCVFQRGRFFSSLIRVLAAHVCGAHRLFPSVRLGRGVRFTLSAHDAEPNAPPIPYQLDGDPGGFLPLEISVEPGRFTLVAPRRYVDRRSRRPHASGDRLASCQNAPNEL